MLLAQGSAHGAVVAAVALVRAEGAVLALVRIARVPALVADLAFATGDQEAEREGCEEPWREAPATMVRSNHGSTLSVDDFDAAAE